MDEINWRTNPPFTYEQLVERWKARGYRTSWWLRLLVPQLSAHYWARIQYDQMMDELEQHRRRTYSPLIGAYWADSLQG